MAAPSSPYCKPTDVAILLRNMAPAGDFSSVTTPTRAAVESLILLYGGWLESRYAAIGYYMPWQEYTGETWPSWQTSFLQLMVSVGVAGAISGPLNKPAPALGRERGQADNIYSQDWKGFLDQIQKDGHGFRALMRVGSRAEQFVLDPQGPATDYLLGYFDVTRFQMVDEYTALIESVRQDYQVRLGLWPWDHLKANRQTLIGV